MFPTAVFHKRPAWNNAVDVRMVRKILPPGMKDGEKGHFPAEIFFVVRKSLKRFGDCLEENSVKRFFITERKGIKLFGNGKDDMEIVYGQKVANAMLDPL